MRSTMNPELVAWLVAAHRRIFAAASPKSRDANLHHGIDCGDGWYTLIDTLCATLQFAADHGDDPQPLVVAVKEIHGRLSVQLRRASEYQQGMIEMADALSARLCDQCGDPGRLHLIPAEWQSGLRFNDPKLHHIQATRCPHHLENGRDIGRRPDPHVTQDNLTATLRAAHPQLFGKPQALPLGIECGPGWFALIDTLCRRLTLDAFSRGTALPTVKQVKEKIGGLRFHTFDAGERQRGMITFAIAMSERLCEVCGHHGANQALPAGGVATRCTHHR